MFDIATLAVADTAAIHLKGPDGTPLYADGKPVRIHIYSPGSAAFAEVEDRQRARTVKRLHENEGKTTLTSVEQRDAEVADDLATMTASFDNLAYTPAGDKQGKELFRALYADKKLGFIVEQVSKALGDWGKFTPGSTAS